MKPSVAIVRGPNLNQWEMQFVSPLMDEFDITGFTSAAHNFDVSGIPFPVRKLFSVGQALRARALRFPMTRLAGDYHDLQGLGAALAPFDIVHAAETSYYCTAQAARAKRPGQKLVVTVWENIPFLQDHPAARALKRSVFAAADLFLPTSERAAEALRLEGAPADRIRVQFPGVNTEHFRPVARDAALLHSFGCAEGDLVVLYVANLYREKGIFDLLHAFKRIVERKTAGAPVRLLIGGKGREREAVEALIARLDLGGSARLIGSHPYASMPAIHALADVFVLPSIPIPTWQEQFGYVLAESMACGKPVVSTLSGSIPEVVGEAGRLVPPNDVLSLATAIEELLADPAARARLGTEGRRRVESLMAVGKVSADLRAHYRSLLA